MKNNSNTNANTPNAIEISDAELEQVAGGARRGPRFRSSRIRRMRISVPRVVPYTSDDNNLHCQLK